MGLSLSSVLNAASCVSHDRDDRGRDWSVTWFVATLFSQWCLSSTQASLQRCFEYHSTRCEGRIAIYCNRSVRTLYLSKHSIILKHYKQIHVKYENDHFVCDEILALSFMKHACLRTGGQIYCDTVSKHVLISLRCLRFLNNMSMTASVG